MKFILNTLNHCTPRIGTLKEFERLPNIILETPLLLIYTKVLYIYLLINQAINCK